MKDAIWDLLAEAAIRPENHSAKFVPEAPEPVCESAVEAAKLGSYMPTDWAPNVPAQGLDSARAIYNIAAKL